jgi:hypothetical protein
VRWFGRGRTAVTIDDDQASEFASLVSGKRVAVVGPAMTLIGTNSGSRIDAHDVVVRFNEVIAHLPVSPEHAADVGTRCDVVYSNQVELRRLTALRHSDQQARLAASAQAGLRYIVCANNSLSYGADGRPMPSCPRPDRDVPRRAADTLVRVATGTRLRMVHRASVEAMARLGGCYGRSGFIAILDLLGCGVSELLVTGVTFYHGGGHLYAQGAVPLEPRGNAEGGSTLDGSGRGHDSVRELAVFRSIVSAHPSIVRVDESLSKLLHYGPDLDERSQH